MGTETAEEGYNSTAWESSDHSDFQTSAANSYGRPTLQMIDSLDSSQQKSTSPQPRSSTDSVARSSTSRWRESPTVVPERRDTITAATSDIASLVEPSFDEHILRALCELDCGVPLLLDRIKQSMVSCREASTFFKKRAVIEDEYGKSLQKLARVTSDTYGMSDGKAGSFVGAWQSCMRVHELMAENRLRFSQRLNEMSEELGTLAKEVDKNRKQTKDLATRYERALQESEAATGRSKNRLDMASEELERILLQKEGESLKDNTVQARQAGTGGSGRLGKLSPKGLQRQEDDVRTRMSTALDTYRKCVTDTQAMRQEYFNFQLPRILRALKECADEIDLGTQYHLTRYAFLFESIVLSDGSTLLPPGEEGTGLKASIETIDNRSDFKTYMQNYAYARGTTTPRGPRRDGPSEEGFLPPLPTHHDRLPQNLSNGANGIHDKGRPTFGVDLAEQMSRDNVEVPPIMVKCCVAIEMYGLKSQGIYRLSGMTSKVANLRQRLDKDLEAVDLDAPEWSGDINTIASVLKMWLRELPDPLLTTQLHQGFIDAAKIENDRLRHIRLHERVNDLPDPNYATLKYFMGHLHRINQHASDNSMSTQNLSIVFGPTLFGQTAPPNGQMNGGIADAPFQNQAIATILNHYTDIFVDETE
ncbi:Rho GTPase activation protein [Infundibulicybe gibba]|nr:Rho GTPase activation protein [Infundibulicybe gibba]